MYIHNYNLTKCYVHTLLLTNLAWLTRWRHSLPNSIDAQRYRTADKSVVVVTTDYCILDGSGIDRVNFTGIAKIDGWTRSCRESKTQ